MSKTLSAIIVDDEVASRDILASYLTKYCTGVTIKASCKDIATAQTAIEKHQPDVVFLDIEMPYGDGFDLLERIPERNFEVIFITAFDHYAIKALNLSALYYLLKPIDIDELVQAVEKVREQEALERDIKTQVLLEHLNPQHTDKKIVIPQMSGFDVLPVKEILYAKAADNYTEIFEINGKKHLVSKPLKHFEDILSDLGFIRIHKSHLISLNAVITYKKGKTAQVKLTDGTWLDVSAKRKNEFLAHFK